MSVIHAPRQPELDVRHLLLLGVGGLCLLIIFLRLWYVQVVKAEDFITQAERARRSSVDKLAPRGLIYDRQNQLVAGVRPQSVITAIPDTVKKKPWVLDKLAGMLGVPVKKLKSKLADGTYRPFLPIPIYADVSIELASKIAESGEDLPGIGVETQPMRYYPNGTDLAHLLGYVWTPSKRDIERMTPKLEEANRTLPPYVGKDGIERQYDLDLMGFPGAESMEVDSKRRPVRVVGRTEPTPGKRLYLSIDLGLQKYANAVLTQWLMDHPKSGAAIVAIEPATGEILALSSAPTFDASKFVGGISTEDYSLLLQDPRKPLINRAIAAEYSPGSTFKIATTIAAMKAGTFDPNRYTVCRGGIQIGKTFLRCTGHHGAISFHRAMQQSCNAYFCDLAMRTRSDNLMGIASQLGIGKRTGIDIPGESSGLLPTDEVRAGDNRFPAELRLGDVAQMGIGQGYLNTTPLQMAQLVALVANRGKSYQPHLVRAFSEAGELVKVEPKIAHEIDLAPEQWDLLDDALRSVINAGTGGNARIAGVDWGGKTGSTEFGRKVGNTHSWFVGIAPMNNPKIVIAVLAEKAGHGGEVAAPIAGAVVKHYLDSLSKREAASNAASAAANR
jgi:penicillin-binding protein 2